jgi:hypothetical protein
MAVMVAACEYICGAAAVQTMFTDPCVGKETASVKAIFVQSSVCAAGTDVNPTAEVTVPVLLVIQHLAQSAEEYRFCISSLAEMM